MENKETNEEILSPEEMEIPSELIDKSGLDEETILNVRRIYKTQKKEKKEDGSGWDFWNERVHVENLLCQRFNYLILCYSLFITAFAVIPDKTSKIILLSIGFIVVFLLSLFNRRAWHKFDINLRCVLVIQEKCNGVRLIDEIAEKKSKWIDRFIIKHGRYNRLIGQTIPIILCLSLFFGILSISLGWWDVEAHPETTPPQQPIPAQNHNLDNSQPSQMKKDTIYQLEKDTIHQLEKDTIHQL
jgi:hypothetical protein